MNAQLPEKVIKTEQLADAFRAFNELSAHLSASYQGLEEQVAKLHGELSQARSERLKTLEEKEKLASRLEKILAALPAGVIVLDAEGKILDYNALAVAFLGDPLRGLSWTKVVELSFNPDFDNPHERRLLNGKPVSITYSQLESDEGQIILLSDVSEMRSLQELLNQQKQLSAMGEMVASMAHQVRTPLATAILYASQLDNVTLDEVKRQRFTQKILERLQYLERQVNDMLIFAKDGRLAMEHFSLQALLDCLSESLKDYVGQGKVKLSITNSYDQNVLLGNENALRGALMNVLNNAVDALATHPLEMGCIDINVSQSDARTLKIVIKDNGPGFGKEQCQRIFEPFYTTKINGTGLGLAVVDSVVRAHGGQVFVASAVGAGATFTFMLPCIKPDVGLLPGGFSGKNLHQENHHETI